MPAKFVAEPNEYMIKSHCFTKIHLEAQKRQRLVLLEQGWQEASGGRWVNPRTGMVTDFRGALDRESLRNTFINLQSRNRARRLVAEGRPKRGVPVGNHVSPVRKAQFA